MALEQPPPFEQDQRESMPPLLKILIWILCGALFVGIYAASGAFEENTFAYALGQMMVPIVAGLGTWYFAGRRGDRKADMTSPLVIVIALGAALLTQGGDLIQEATGSSDTPDLATRFVPIEGYDYRDLSEREADAVEAASPELDEVSEEHSYQILTKGGEDIAMVLVMAVDKEAATAEGFAEDFASGMEQVSDAGVDEVDVAGETGFSAEQQGTPVLGLVDEDDGVVVTLGGITDDDLVELGEHYARSF